MQQDNHLNAPKRGDMWQTSIGRIVYVEYTPAQYISTAELSEGRHRIYINGELRTNIAAGEFDLMMASLETCDYIGNVA